MTMTWFGLIFLTPIPVPFPLPATRPFYEQRLTSCLRALAEPSSPAAVADVAVQLAIQHALARGVGAWRERKR